MRTLETKSELREALGPARAAGQRIGLVPTMGFFHEGHLSLMRAARERCDLVVVSVFVNPTQFGPNEDLDAYPRDPGRDSELAAAEGVDLLWTPSAEEMYPDGFATAVEVDPELAGVLDGDPDQRGAGHFRGVATIVAKLLNCVRPDAAFFGRKDAQQAIVIERMASDLDFPVEIVVMPTVRDADGLALSSRNSLSERRRARHRARDLARAARRRVGGPAGGALGRGADRCRRAGSSRRPASSRSTSRRAERTTSAPSPS